MEVLPFEFWVYGFAFELASDSIVWLFTAGKYFTSLIFVARQDYPLCTCQFSNVNKWLGLGNKTWLGWFCSSIRNDVVDFFVVNVVQLVVNFIIAYRNATSKLKTFKHWVFWQMLWLYERVAKKQILFIYYSIVTFSPSIITN